VSDSKFLLVNFCFRSRNITLTSVPTGEVNEHPILSRKFHNVPAVGSVSGPLAATNRSLILRPVVTKTKGIRSWSKLKNGDRRLVLENVPPSVAKALGGEAFRGRATLSSLNDGSVCVRIDEIKPISELVKKNSVEDKPVESGTSIDELKSALQKINKFLELNPDSEVVVEHGRIQIKVVV
jgi:hypothetical protein